MIHAHFVMLFELVKMNDNSVRDRYITFTGLDCDTNASKLVDIIRHYIQNRDGSEQWASYFEGKLQEKERLHVDDLFFIGSQMNNVYAFFDELGDTEAHDLLYQVEQECC